MKTIRLGAIGVAVCLLSASAASTGPGDKFTLESAFALKNVADASVSPDGKWVLYSLEEKALAQNQRFQNFWLVSSDGVTRRALTSGREENGEAAWAPDSRQIAFVAGRGDSGAIKVLRIDGGPARALRSVKGGGSRPKWSPDGKAIAYLAAEPLTEKEKREAKLRQNDVVVTDSARRPARLWTVAADESSEPRVLTTGARQVNEFAWAPDGQRIAMMTSPATVEFEGISQTHVVVVNRDGSNARDLPIERAWSFSDISWSPDGKYVLFKSSYPGLKLAEGRFNLVDVASGKTTVFPPNFDGGVSGYTWAGAGTIIFSASTGVVGRLFQYELKSGHVTPLGAVGERLFRALSSDKTGANLVFVARDANNPGDLYTTPLPAFTPKQLSDVNPQLRQLTLGTTETVTWKGADGWPMDGVLVKPVDYQAGKRYPTIVIIHGGPTGINAKAFDPFWQMLAGRGYAVFAPNPRGGGGHGDKFIAANYRDFGGKDFQDIMAGVDRVIQMGVADSDKLGVWGWSYGGYMTYWVVTHTTRFKAAMSGAGMANLASFYAQSDIQAVWSPAYFGASPYKDRDIYNKVSAINSIDKVTTPTLILYGAQDVRVPPAQGREFYVGLREMGVPTQLVLYPREGHGFREPDHERDRWQRSIDWFDRYVLKKAVPAATP